MKANVYLSLGACAQVSLPLAGLTEDELLDALALQLKALAEDRAWLLRYAVVTLDLGDGASPLLPVLQGAQPGLPADEQGLSAALPASSSDGSSTSGPAGAAETVSCGGSYDADAAPAASGTQPQPAEVAA